MYPCGLLFYFFGCILLQLIHCYSDGSLLEDECQGMNINHGRQPQTGESPFTVDPENKTFNDSEVGQTLTVQLLTNSSPFIGFMLEARKCEECNPAGTFSLIDSSSTVLLTCDGQHGRAVSHSNNLNKYSIKVTWRVPEAGTFYFRAAITNTYSKFWLRKPIARLTTAALRSTPISALTTAETTAITTNGILQTLKANVTALALNANSQTSLQSQSNATAITTNGVARTSLQPQANTTAVTTNGVARTSLQPQANTTAVTTNSILQISQQTQSNTTAVTTNSILQTSLRPQANTTAVTTSSMLQITQSNTMALTTNDFVQKLLELQANTTADFTKIFVQLLHQANPTAVITNGSMLKLLQLQANATAVITNSIRQILQEPQANATAVFKNDYVQILLQLQANTTAVFINGVLQILQPQANATAVFGNGIVQTLFIIMFFYFIIF